jgi:hypothetical protein
MLFFRALSQVRARGMVLAAADAVAENLESDLSPSLVHQSKFRCGGNPQALKRFLEAENFC